MKAGLYKPTGTPSRSQSFALKNGVTIYGGFTGNESTLSQRSLPTLTNPSSTTLSGEIGDLSTVSDNVYHIVIGVSDAAATATVGTTDIAGNPRFMSGRIDMGAYEFCAPATRLYVRAGATGANTGQSWTDAFTSLQSALSYPCSQSLTEIWVTGRTYKPTSTTSRTVSFRMLPNVAIYGGFVGSETALNER